MLGELCNIYVDSHTCNYILNLFFSFCLGLTVKQVSEARRLCINATVINGVDGEFQKQGYYATTGLREKGGWGDSEVKRLMRQCDSAKGVDGELQK